MECLNHFLSTAGFIPHGHCYLWKTDLVSLHVASDAIIALSYFSIPILLVYFISKRRDIPFNGIFLLFGGFIIACGTGHLMNIWTLWHPNYWMAGFIKGATAIISFYTALSLIPLIPKILALPSPAQLETANRELAQALNQLQQTQAQLIQTEKMSSLGQLVAGIAHEINNPVNFISGNLSHISQYSDELLNLLHIYHRSYPQPTAEVQKAVQASDLEFLSEDLPKVLSSMRVGAERIRQIVLSLRNFSRLDEAAVKEVNIHEGIDSTLMILQHRLKAKAEQPAIEIIKEYGELPLVECYPSQLNQAFMNLISNAIDVLDEKQQGHYSNSQTASRVIKIHTEVTDKKWISVHITDNGSGMTEETCSKLFTPFFTTKPVGRGTGLGLSISHHIVVEKHAGKIFCNSAPGKGAEFVIQIPVRQTAQNTNGNLPQLLWGMELACSLP